MANLNRSVSPLNVHGAKPMPVYENLGAQKRLKFLQRAILVGVLTIVIFLATNDLRASDKLPGVIGITELGVFMFSYIASFYSKKHKVLFNITIISVVLFTVGGFYGSSATRSIFLVPITALVAYLLLSRIGGVVWTIVIICLTFVVYLLDRLGLANMQADPNLMVFGIVSLLITSLLMYVYEGINVNNEQLVATRDRELFDLNQKLSQQLKSDKDTAKKLTRTLEATQKNNQILINTKLAIMNILEDTNELQEQLRAEKENVEQTVLERTDQLRQEQARLGASINSLESGFLMTFQDNHKAMFNPALQELLGLKDLGDKAHGDTTSSYIKLVQVKLGKSFDLAGAIKKSQKTAVPFSADNIEFDNKFISISGAPIILEGQKHVIGCVILMNDKTAEIMFERSKDEFISIASHELRTPLTAIRGNASMLEMMYGDKMPNKDAKTMLSDIKDSSVRLINIVNQFLTTSRLEQKRTVFDKKPVDIGKSIVYCAGELANLIDEKKLKLIINVPDVLPLVLADDTRAQEVIVNILGNAIKYTDKGTITITAHAIDGFVQIDFTDTGVGIDPQSHDLLFHKFQQASSDILTRDDSRSTGLGLYITKQLVEQMGGTIYLGESRLGHGSTFTFTLPITKVK